MNGIHPISRERHARLNWQRYQNYKFAASTSVVPLAAAEVGKATLAMPLTFVKRGDSWSLAALLGLLPNQNLFVHTDGAWLSEYVPAAFRAYPFVVRTHGASELTLCVDENSGLLTDGPDGEPFFDETGELSHGLGKVWNFLLETARSEATMRQAADLLASVGVIEPWPITLQAEDGNQQVAGLNCINEERLNSLDEPTYAQLRRAGVLSVAYAQLLSMSRLSKLGQLAQLRAQAAAAEYAKGKVKPMIALPDDSTIDWDWSKVGKP